MEDGGNVTPIRTPPPPPTSSLSDSKPLTRSQTKKIREERVEDDVVENEDEEEEDNDVQGDEEWGLRGGVSDQENMEAVFRVGSKIMRTPPKSSSHLV